MVFFQTSKNFLGHILSADGISSNPGKVDKVRNWPVPKSAKELHSFLGLALYYHQFIPNFSHMAKCLHQLSSLTNGKKNKGKGDLIRFNWIKQIPIHLDVRTSNLLPQQASPIWF